MKPALPNDSEALLQKMVGYLPALYFPSNTDDDTIHQLARNEFFRVQKIMRRQYNTEEEENDSQSPFDEVETNFEQAVYERIRFDSNTIRLSEIKEEAIRIIRDAVKKQNNIIGTFYKNRGVRHRKDKNSKEYVDSPIVVIHNSGYYSYGGYEAGTVYDLFMDEDNRLFCTLNGEAGEDFDEPIEHIQVEGLLEIVHWLEEHNFIPSNHPQQKYEAWQHGKQEMHIVSIEIYNRITSDSSSGSDNIFYDRKSALNYFTEYFEEVDFSKTQDSYFVCTIRHFAPPLEERQNYPAAESLFDLSDWLSVEPYYVQTVNK